MGHMVRMTRRAGAAGLVVTRLVYGIVASHGYMAMAFTAVATFTRAISFDYLIRPQ